MKFTIENTKHLERHFKPELTLIKNIARTGRNISGGMDGVKVYLRRTFPAWFVYRGGNHVAIHAGQYDDRRIMIVTD